jgi:hypothetical protein
VGECTFERSRVVGRRAADGAGGGVHGVE